MQHRKITDADIAQYGMVSQPDRMVGTAQENKAAFDRLVRECVRVQFNALCDDLIGSTCAASLGAADGTVQSSLDEKAKASDLAAHTQNRQNPHGVTKTQLGLSAVANERQYSAQNPPPYPVAAIALGDEVLAPDGTGAVHIPLAQNDGAAGAVSITRSKYGLEIAADGGLRIYPANEQNLANRHGSGSAKNSYRPITTLNLDSAVRAALCDGTGDVWSEAEKGRARARMGITSAQEPLTHLADITDPTDAECVWEAPCPLQTLYFHLSVPTCNKVFQVSFETENGSVFSLPAITCGGKKAEVMLTAEVRHGRLHATAAQSIGGEAKSVAAGPELAGKIAAEAIVSLQVTCDGTAMPSGTQMHFDGIGVSA